jgi:HD-like signal output (HDOD) protein
VAAAVARVGLNETRGLVISASITEGLAVKPTAHIASFQLHSVVCAAATSLIAARSGVLRVTRENPYFTSALLHDIGLLALAHFSPIALVEVVDFAVANKSPLADIERIAMGYSHAEVGALLLQRWRLSQLEIDACRWHHDILAAPPSAGPVPALVHLADMLARDALGGDTLTALVPEFEPRALEVLQLAPEALPELTQEVALATAPARAMAAAYFVHD